MSSPLTQKDALVLAICSALVLAVLFTRSDFDNCVTPIDDFLLAAYMSIIALTLIWNYLASPSVLSSVLKFRIFLLLFIILCPIMILITVQGLIWQIKIQTSTPSCGNFLVCTVWVSVLALAMIDVLYILLIAGMLWAIWSFAQERRRIRETIRLLNDLEGEQLRDFLLTLNTAENFDFSLLGLSQAEIDRIPTKTFKTTLLGRVSQEEKCPICLSDFEEGSEILEMPGCGHKFDPSCAAKWLEKAAICPMCRKNVRMAMAGIDTDRIGESNSSSLIENRLE